MGDTSTCDDSYIAVWVQVTSSCDIDCFAQVASNATTMTFAASVMKHVIDIVEAQGEV